MRRTVLIGLGACLLVSVSLAPLALAGRDAPEADRRAPSAGRSETPAEAAKVQRYIGMLADDDPAKRGAAVLLLSVPDAWAPESVAPF